MVYIEGSLQTRSWEDQAGQKRYKTEIKANNERVSHYNLARAALVAKDVAGAQTPAEEFRKGVEAANNPKPGKPSHELAGHSAHAEKDSAQATAR